MLVIIAIFLASAHVSINCRVIDNELLVVVAMAKNGVKEAFRLDQALEITGIKLFYIKI